MRFGRVEGIIQVSEQGGVLALHLTVYLEVGASLEVVRSGAVLPLGAVDSRESLSWHADQYTQETIGNEMAELGWETIAQEQSPPASGDSLPRSASYIVRNLH